MYVEILAKSEDAPSRGKSTRFNTATTMFSVELCTDELAHLDSPPWYLQCRAEGSRDLSSGERGGEMRTNKYRLELQLTPSDLTRLFQFALSKGLLEVAAIEKPLSLKRGHSKRGDG
jgi:hypothetical protein